MYRHSNLSNSWEVIFNRICDKSSKAFDEIKLQFFNSFFSYRGQEAVINGISKIVSQRCRREDLHRYSRQHHLSIGQLI